ncbi:unnamed protein product [Blepharisma stoltei]|uniref:RING-type domain-containing protein n=1 Tax=Blepharisma stoltei TaxID=1481888 RepID=A0AAU9KL67_9CILI|nr:unnamed protein product [Blepharisma stoltei]
MQKVKEFMSEIFASKYYFSPYNFTCILCKQPIVLNATVECGHTFCEVCITEHLLENDNCPICNRNIKKTDFYPNLMLDEIIVSLIDKNEIFKYLSRKKFWMEIKENSKVMENVKVGEKIDIKDEEGIWRKGVVKLVVGGEGYSDLYVHYEGWENQHDEFLPNYSNRLAIAGFYTKN